MHTYRRFAVFRSGRSLDRFYSYPLHTNATTVIPTGAGRRFPFRIALTMRSACVAEESLFVFGILCCSLRFSLCPLC